MEQDGHIVRSDKEPGNLKIRRILAKNGVISTDQLMGKMEAYVAQLLDWNQKINLVSRKDTENIWEAHILHSLSIVLQEVISEGASVLDLGTGGGLPGIPVKILRPDISLTLLDATRKKADAVAAMVSAVGLENVNVLWGRAEDETARKELGQSFDIVIARAVASLEDLAAWSRPLLRRGGAGPGRLIALKGGDIEGETAKAKRVAGVGDVSVKDLTFYGAEMIPGVNKKIVCVTFL